MASVLLQTPAGHPTEGPDDGTAVDPGRDPVLDLVRAVALAIVVVWHWSLSTLWMDETGAHAGNPVGVVPGLWALTWLLQPMPLFFVVGGALHARSLVGQGGRAAVGFRARRVRRLVVPALPLVVPAASLAGAALLLGWPAVAGTVVLLVSPLWFLAVYLVLVLVAPLAVAAHRRAPRAALLGLVAAVVCVDVARFGHGWSGWVPVVGGFCVTWAAVHQLGFHLDALRRAPLPARAGVALVGFVALAALTGLGPYPRAMVGVPGEPVSNLAPPNATVLALAVAQLGLLALVAEPAGRWAARRRRGLAAVGAWSMTVYVWHLVAYGAFAGLVVLAGHEVSATPDAAWWAERPLWLLGPAAVALPLCAVTRRFDRPRYQRSSAKVSVPGTVGRNGAA